MSENFPRKWEPIDLNTERLRVPGGWLVRISDYDRPLEMTFDMASFAALSFFPDPDHRWVLEDDEVSE